MSNEHVLCIYCSLPLPEPGVSLCPVCGEAQAEPRRSLLPSGAVVAKVYTMRPKQEAARLMKSAAEDPDIQRRQILPRPVGIWSCKVGIDEQISLSVGADAPMRAAVQEAYKRLVGLEPRFCFSGWNASLNFYEKLAVGGDASVEPPAHYVDTDFLRIVDTCNFERGSFGRDDEPERFVGPPMSEEDAEAICTIFNKYAATRFYKAVPLGYKLRNGAGEGQ